jgi:hypothetical protein
VEVSMNLNELLVKQLQSKERELAAIKEKQMQEVVITQEQKQQAELLAQIAVEKYKQEIAKAEEIEE